MTTTVKLYEHAEARDILDELLAETEGEVTPEIETLLNEWQDATNEKVEKVALYIQEQAATVGALDAEIARLTARKNARKKAVEGLKGYLLANLTRMGIPKVNGLLVTVAVQKNPPSVKGELDQQVLGAMYASPNHLWSRFVKRVPESFTLDRKAVIEAAKADAPIPAGLVVEQSSSLRIR